MSNLLTIVTNSPLTPISGGYVALNCTSSQILHSGPRWLRNSLQNLHSYKGALTPHHSLVMTSGKVTDKRYSQKTEPGPWATKNKRVSPGEQNQGQISEMRQGASDLND